MTGRTTIALLLTTALAACGGAELGTAPTPDIGPLKLTITNGKSGTDTVEAMLSQAVVIQVLAGTVARPGIAVRFNVLPGTNAAGSARDATASIARVSSLQFGTTVVDTTDAAGRASVAVRLGTTTGIARITVGIGADQAADTARFVITPGQGIIRITARNEGIVPGRTYNLGASATDRFNNPIPLRYAAGPYVTALDTAGNVTVSQSGGAGYVAVQSAFASDTARFTSLPGGRFATLVQGNPRYGSLGSFQGYGANDVALVDLTGSNLKVLLPCATGACVAPTPSPNGSLVAFEASGQSGGSRIDVVDLAGVRRALVSQTQLFSATLPQFSPDGSSVYFLGRATDTSMVALWRISTAGGLPQRLATLTTTERMGYSVSRDGLRVAYPDTSKARTLVVQDISTGVKTRLGGSQVAGGPSFSPDGRQVAFVDLPQQTLVIANSDGSDWKRIGVSAVFFFNSTVPPTSWTADGAWVLVRGQYFPILVNAATGTELVVPGAGPYIAPMLP